MDNKETHDDKMAIYGYIKHAQAANDLIAGRFTTRHLMPKSLSMPPGLCDAEQINPADAYGCELENVETSKTRLACKEET